MQFPDFLQHVRVFYNTLMLILGWGYQPERMQAGLYLMMYTLSASLPLLGGISMLGRNALTYFFDELEMAEREHVLVLLARISVAVNV